MSKILCWITQRNEEILQIGEELKAMGHETRVFFADDYYQTCSYFGNKLDEWGWKRWRQAYLRQKREMFEGLREAFAPDIILFVNFSPIITSWENLRRLSGEHGLRFWYVDRIAGWKEAEGLVPFRPMVYDKESMEYLTGLGIRAEYCPVGYNQVYRIPPKEEKDYDIAFVGLPYKNRLTLLETLAESAQEKGWRLGVFGPFYETKYFWKGYFFRSKYPMLFRYLGNRPLAPARVASVYAGSRICLNIHEKGSLGVNPRTFAIMATGAMELMDERRDYDIVRPGVDAAVFRNEEDMLAKVAYYLEHPKEREIVARSGYERVLGVRSMRTALQRVLEAGK